MILISLMACAPSPEPQFWRLRYQPAVLDRSHDVYDATFVGYEGWDSDDVEAEPSEWMSEESGTMSDGVTYVSLQVDADGGAVATNNSDVLFGTYADGVLEVEWDWFTTNSSRDEHESGYVYEDVRTDGMREVLSLTVDGDIGAGVIRYVDYDERETSQSDVWVDDLTASSLTAEAADGTRFTNHGEAQDCADNLCTVRVEHEDVWLSEFTAERVYSDQPAYLIFVGNGTGVE